MRRWLVRLQSLLPTVQVHIFYPLFQRKKSLKLSRISTIRNLRSLLRDAPTQVLEDLEALLSSCLSRWVDLLWVFPIDGVEPQRITTLQHLTVIFLAQIHMNLVIIRHFILTLTMMISTVTITMSTTLMIALLLARLPVIIITIYRIYYLIIFFAGCPTQSHSEIADAVGRGPRHVIAGAQNQWVILSR